MFDVLGREILIMGSFVYNDSCHLFFFQVDERSCSKRL